MILLIAGRPGNATRELEALIESTALGNSVRLLGHRSDVADLLCAADVFVFPSLFEGFGGALLEAATLAVPIVASNIPSTREVLGDTYPLLCAPSAEGLVGALTQALSDGDLAARAAAEAAAAASSIKKDNPIELLARHLRTLARSSGAGQN